MKFSRKMGLQIICFLLIYSLSEVKTNNHKDIVKYTKFNKYEESEQEGHGSKEDYLFFIDNNDTSVTLKEVNKFINHVYKSSENILQEVINKKGRMSKTKPKKKFLRKYSRILNNLINKDLIFLSAYSNQVLNDILRRVIHASETGITNIIENDNYSEHFRSKVVKKLARTKRNLYEHICSVFNVCRSTRVWTDIFKDYVLVIIDMASNKLLEFYKAWYPICVSKINFNTIMHPRHIRKLMRRTAALTKSNEDELRHFTVYYKYFFSHDYVRYEFFLKTLDSIQLDNKVDNSYATVKYDLELWSQSKKNAIETILSKLFNNIQRDIDRLDKRDAENIKKLMDDVMWDLEH